MTIIWNMFDNEVWTQLVVQQVKYLSLHSIRWDRAQIFERILLHRIVANDLIIIKNRTVGSGVTRETIPPPLPDFGRNISKTFYFISLMK